MHLSRLTAALLAVLGLSFATAPLANAAFPTPPAASIAVNNAAKPASYYYRRSYENCERPYVKHHHRRHYGRYYDDDHSYSAYRPAKRYRYWDHYMQRRYYTPSDDYDDDDNDNY